MNETVTINLSSCNVHPALMSPRRPTDGFMYLNFKKKYFYVDMCHCKHADWI